ncbi:bifunctional protein FolC [Ameyamaea chiangmaiensis NBRC 103196]|uniref:Dihydrofolate synthase/folylpolyglutamate synthase n=1 Tax=Ameyamaea chiangmaiensis TaxID=442969 RepID=A0A850PBK2_9PROT|nr:folylpolyglutamate synthase/dihydrofolate synthase family protein [Ameyamaea chiangmaiensis]MBS4074935.1 bifunctional folylpolyglutamate synthase/dihydrofolate synthase [Ameyamaea chiangmaiensis]NVN41328.1 bifunctional folylpolyglutamate synthase/dihydrofolate synthase [Ameyamaea chiangmaiensis]GBQ63252.1 bifunctional protein FolC [Ameyamaea chiangmaiensis NBRC 103196]
MAASDIPAAGSPPLGAEFTGRTGAVLERLNRLYPALIDLSLGRLERLLGALGNPHLALPPVIHVAGTNGKGSTCANLRAIAEAAGLRVHVMTSPHLVDVTERFRVAGTLVREDDLLAVLEEVERVNGDAPITVFEVLTAAGFVLFARNPADLVVLEVGLGGRFDATNVLPRPAACAISRISLDHEAFLGPDLVAIAGEKAGIIKPGVPVVTVAQDRAARTVLSAVAEDAGSAIFVQGQDWSIEARGAGVRYSDARGTLDLPAPALSGPHQMENAGLAIAALRASGLALPDDAYAGIASAHWPARLQRLTGTLASLLPPGWELWLDGGHNPGAGQALSAVLAGWDDRPLHLLIGMKQTKDAAGFIAPLLPHATTVHAVAEPDQHLALPVDAVIDASAGVAQAGPTVKAAIERLVRSQAAPSRVVICGSLYLAGVVLRADGFVPR